MQRAPQPSLGKGSQIDETITFVYTQIYVCTQYSFCTQRTNDSCNGVARQFGLVSIINFVDQRRTPTFSLLSHYGKLCSSFMFVCLCLVYTKHKQPMYNIDVLTVLSSNAHSQDNAKQRIILIQTYNIPQCILSRTVWILMSLHYSKRRHFIISDRLGPIPY